MANELKITLIRHRLFLPGDLMRLSGKSYVVCGALSSTEYIVRPVTLWWRLKYWLWRKWLGGEL